MALGVLNNLSAVYAEKNLNNTNASLQKVLQQLSSGSRINSGADDSAGLSLVNGLAANEAALSQSETNATEGVGLLQVADGALSQVTSLLNRAITLATEASNGTLNTAQASAANQEYQTILAEITNIGSTTTFNQQQVFSGMPIDIYTGDSSTSGSSIDRINIRSLSISSVGDTGGEMSYSSGQNDVFLNLSTAGTNAQMTDTLNSTGTTTMQVQYLVNGASGAQTTASAVISAGAGTRYSNTVSGLIDAINDAGLGLTATFATQAQAGVTGGGGQTGIQISGGLVAAGVDPSDASTSGTFNASGIPASELLTLGQTVTVNRSGSTNPAAQVTISSTINTLAELAAAINTQAGAGTATVITNGDGTQSLVLNNTSAGSGALSVTVTSGNGASAPVFGSPTTAIDAKAMTTQSNAVTGTAATPAANGSYTFGTGTTNNASDLLSAGTQITLSNSLSGGTKTETFIVGSGSDVPGSTYYTGNYGGNTLDALKAAINASTLGATAAISSSGITVASNTAATGDNITASGNTLSQANNGFQFYNPTLGGTGIYSTAVLQLDPSNPQITTINDGSDPLTGSFSVTSHGVTNTYIIGTGISGGGTYYTGASTITASALATFMTANNTTGIAATAPGSGSGAIYLQAGTSGAAYDITLGSSTLADVYGLGETTTSSVSGVTGVTGSDSTVTLGLASGSANSSDVLAAGSSLSLTNNGVTETFTVGTGTASNTTYLALGATLAQLAAAITNFSSLGLTAQAGTAGLALTSTAPQGTAITVNSNTLADATLGSSSTVTLGSFASQSDTITGTLSFAVNGVAKNVRLQAGATVQSLIAQINSDSTLGVQAAWQSTGNGFGNVVLTSSTEGSAGQLSSPLSALVDTTPTADLTYTAGSGYHTGLSSSGSTIIYDSASGQDASTGAATFVSNQHAGSGIAIVSYSDGAGQSLSGTDLLSQGDSHLALNSLNLAISDVAAMDGYIGAQINTLNSISQVMSTQQENVLSAQNAIQATDYASATSDMSKYEILTQTGIAALAQANSVQQEVTKLLQ